MALKFDPALFSQATANLPASTSQATEQQVASSLPDIEPKREEIKFVSPDQVDANSPVTQEQAVAEQIARQKKADEETANHLEAFIEQTNQRYGIDPVNGVNKLNYKQLDERMRQDGLTSRQMREVQQQWIASAERYRDSLPGGTYKDDLTDQIEKIKEIRATIKPDNWKEKVRETWRNASPAIEAQAERLYDATVQRVGFGLGMLTDTEILEKYDPELLKRVEAKGGIVAVRNAGVGDAIKESTANEDGWGVGGMMTYGTDKETQSLGKELLEKLSNYRAKETLSREDKNGEIVEDRFGNKIHMSNRQASQYYANQESSVAGRKEWQQRFEHDPFGSIKSFSDVGNFIATALDSTIRQAPTVVAGTAAMFFHPVAGLAIMNSGNITDQEMQAVNKAIEDEYKRIHGKDADVTALSADEYAKLSMEVADKGLVSKASAEGVVTGGLMTLAETAMGGLVGKLGGATLAKMPAKDLEKNLLNTLSRISLGGAGYGLKISDEGLQEVSSTIIENVRTGKKWNEGLSQAFLLGAFSIENIGQNASRVANKANQLSKERKAKKEVEQQATAKLDQPADDTVATDNNAETKSVEPTATNAKPTPATDATPNSVNMTPEEKDKLLREYEEVTSRSNEDGVLSDEDAKRATEIEALFQDEDGNNTLIAELNEWNKNGKQVATQGTQNEDRTDDRTSTPDVDGQTNQQGTDEPNGSGSERSSETSEQVSPTQTETTTAGHSQPDPQSSPNPFEQSDDNTPKSNATGLDGRTSETDSTRGEQGELGQNGSEQSGEPTQATSETSTDSGVQQRPQSNSVGETLTPEKRKERIAELENQEREDLAKAESDRDTKIASDYEKSKSDNNSYANSNASQIERDIQSSADAISRFKDNGDQYNVEREDEYLRQAYARKEQITGKSQLEAYKQKRQELGLDKPLTSQATEELNRLRDEEKAYDDQLNAERRKYDEIASIKVGKAGSKENVKNLPRATDAISEATELDNARVAYEKAKELAETIPSKKSRQAKLDEIEQAYAKKQGELKTDTFANRERMEANKAKRDEKRAEAEEEKRKYKDRIRERVRNRKRDSGLTEQSEPQSPVASGEQTPVSDKGTETSTPSDTSAPEQPTKPTSATKPNGRVQDPVNRGEEAARALQEENLASSLKQRFANTVFDLNGMLEAKNKAGLHDIDSLSAEAHTQLMERIKREYEEHVQALLDEIAEIHFAIAKARGLIKEHTKDPATPNQWKRIIATGEKGGASVSAVKGAIKSRKHNPANIVPSSKRRVLPFNADQQERLLAVAKMASEETMAETDPNAKQNSGVKDKKFWAEREKALFIDEFNALTDTQRETLLSTYKAKDVEQLWEEREKEIEAKYVVGGLAPAGVANMQRFEGINSVAFVVRASLRLHNEQVESFLNNETGFADLNRTMAEMSLLDNMPRGIANTKLYKEYRESTEKLVHAIADHFGLPHSLFDVSLGVAYGRDGQLARRPDMENRRITALITLFGRRSAVTQAGVVFHETGHFFIHANVDQEHYHRLMNKFKTNDFIKGLIGRGINDAYRRRGESVQVEEILVDLYAAIKTGDFGRFAERYKIDVGDIPSAFKEDTSENLVLRIYEKLKSIIADILNLEKVSDKDVRSFLDYLSISDDLIENNSKFDEAMTRLSSNYLKEVLYFRNDKAKEQAINFIDEQLYYVDSYEEVKEILDEAEGTLGSKDSATLLEASVDSKTISYAREDSPLRKFLDRIAKAISGFVAIATLGVMTVPNDAMAHTGYSVYESGPKIENVSQQASDTINWVVKQKDHNGKAFVVADKAQGKIHVVNIDGKILNTQNAIFGKNKGDSSAFGNTPSGRFLLHKTDTKNLSDLDKRVFGDSVLDLTDKETGRKVTNDQGQVVAMHRVVNTTERKAALNSATPNDNYLSHGCINIPTAYYNSAVNKLDGAMVYVLGQDGKSNMSNDTAKSSSTNDYSAKSSNTTRSTTKSSTRGSSLEVPKTSKLSFSVKAKDIANISDKVSVDKLQKSLEKTLGDLADKVNFITEADFEKTKGFDKIRNAGVEGFYDPINQRVYIVADNIEAQNGLTAEERMAWVAWHELVHNGLDVKYGEDLRSILYKAQANPFIADLARAIMLDRRDNQLVEVGLDKATEEALAELGAALKIGNVKSLADRYGVQIPVEYQSGLKGIIGRHLIGLRNLVGRLLGKKMFTTKQVERLLEDALKEVNPDKATKEFAQKAIEDVNDPNSALAQAVMFSVAKVAKDFVDDVTHIVTGGDISRTGSTPARDGTKSAKERTTRQGFISRLWTGIQDAQQVIIDLDPEGNGGRLSNAVATFSNKASQMSRKFRSQIKSLEMDFNKFASENKDLFPHRKDRRQIDHVVQDVTSSLRAITGGNESIRKRVETTIFGEDIYDDDGNFIKHNPGLADRVNEYAEYISNAQQQGLQPSSYITAKLKEYTQLLEDQLAIQDKFDQADDTIIARTKNGPDVSRKDWRGHDGFTTAEAEQKLRDLKAKGFIDLDIDSFTKVPYQVKRYVRGKNGQPDSFVVETHYRYETSDLQKAATGRIMPLVDKYVDLSQKMYQTAVRLVGKDIMGNAPSEAWQVGTMGKVRNAYTTKAKDAKGQEIDNVYDVSQSSNIDTIISLRQAAEYQSRLNGRAFNGGTALENLTWHIDLMSKQAASQNIGRVMLDMANDPDHADKIKVYRRNDKDYSTQNGILVTRNKIVNGKPVLDQNGDPVKEVVKVAFADEEANRALFGDNIAREELTNGNLIARALFGTLSSLTRLGSLGLTGSLGFSVSNAYKGYNEKVNQILAWTKDSPFVKSLPRDIQDKYFNNLTTTTYVDKNGNTIVKQVKNASSFVQGSKLQALIARHKAKMLTLRLPAMEVAATRFAQELIDNVKFSNVIHKVTGWSTQAEAEYQKLVKMYEEGGISSRVEELVSSNKDLKARFATGPLASKIASGVGKTLDFASSFTMSQELVSSLMMYDFLTETLDMPPEKAIEANLHFMNFNKRGNWKIMDYIRKYTMFGNAIAQGSKAFQNAWVEQTNDVNDRMFGKLGGPVGYKLSDRAVGRAIRNIAIGAGMNLFLRMLAENRCDDKDKGMGSPFDRLNPYELMRDMPVAYNCGENGPDYFRFPVEYGTGNVENAIGVGFVQYMKGAWSLDQTKDFVLDSLRDNALPVSMPVMKTNDPFQLAISFLMPIVPEPMKGGVLAFGGIDDFGNPLNSMSYQFKDYKPGTGKKTTDSAWTDMAEALYGMGIFGNLSPEQAKVLATSWTQGVFRNLLTNIIEEDPKQSVLGALLGSKSLLREAKGYDKAAYTMAQTYLQDRYKDLNEIAIRAEGTKNGKITDKWLKEHGYEMDEKERKLLTQVEKYRKSLRNKTASQERRYENNVDFIKSMRAIEGYDDN